MDHENPVEELSTEECWDLLRRNELGRIAFHLGPEVHLTPINYGVDGNHLLFRTAPGSKLVGVLMNADIVFEIDEFGESDAWSVIIRGTARRLDEDEVHRADDLGLRPWVPTQKYEVVEITPDTVTGRRFLLERDAH